MSPTVMGESNITVTLHSTYPAGSLSTNYTGVVSVHYIVNSSNEVNFSSLAFLYGINYTVSGDMHSYLKVPENSIASEGIYRGPYRNRTPYLSWEFNDSITNGSVWQWGGYDNDSAYVSKNSINSTHTWINVTGSTQEVLSSSFYIARQSMYESPKTGFEINRAQGIIIKIWDVESIRDRDSNYLIGLVFDTDMESTAPSEDVLIRYCNASFDPDNDDPRTSSYCQDVITADSARWMNHTWIPHANSSYSKPFVVDASDFDPTDTGFLYLASETISSKSFVLNATNYDPGICNRTFAQTESMWTFDESSGASTSESYTPSFFTLFARDYMEMEFQLYIADNQSEWAHSGIDNKSIGLSQYPVDPVTFEYFNVSCPLQGYIIDNMMDATYDEGYIHIGLYCPGDPDGGNVSHNITLNYNNGTLVAVVNNTLITNGSEHVEINFSTSPYYSVTDMYTLKCVSEDEEGSIVTKWLPSRFALAADGTQGWVKDGMLLFWGMNDIPTLYTKVNNDSYISYSDNIYTMHVPFFKSKCNDTFLIDETVHLESLNDINISFFRFSGITIFNGATIHAWNTTSNTIAPDSDTYRGYLFSCCDIHGNITNSNLSYLGSNIYRKEGLNFVGSSFEYLIYNTTLSHNGEGVVMEDCSNFNISHCTITDNINVGIGIYYSNDTIIANNTIDSNGGSGLIMYKAHNNVIRYNNISNSGDHGVRFWFNSQNNSCIGNDITGSAVYDYYLSSSSTNNFIIDPVSSTNKIRSTSTSSVNVENTDNQVFTDDSLNTSYAYPTNFSIFVSNVSQTFNIAQRNITIIPSTDKLSIWNLEWDTRVKFNVSSDTGINPTWFNLTDSSWASETINIYRNDTLYTTEVANGNGLITYNYSDSYSEKYFEFEVDFVLINPNPSGYTEVIEEETATFSISSSILGNSTWTLDDGYRVGHDSNSMNPSYTILNTLSLGAHSLTINSSDIHEPSNTDEFTWHFLVKTRPIPSAGGSSGSSTAPSPGASTEPSYNVECYETGRITNLNNEKESSYIVKNNECIKVTRISFIPTINSKEQSVYIEALKSKSIFTTENVPNIPVHNFNLFVGYLGYDSRTEQEKIYFELRKDFIDKAELDETSIKLYKWSEEKETWIRKYTDLVDSDEYYYHYESYSGATSGYFAISGEELRLKDTSLLRNIMMKIPGLGNLDLIIPESINEPIIKPFFNSIEMFVNGLITDYVPGLAPKEDVKIIGFTIAAGQETNVENNPEAEKKSSILNPLLILLISLIIIGAFFFYYNLTEWKTSVLAAVVITGIIYICFGNNMIHGFDSSAENLFINIILISTISCSVPTIFEEIRKRTP